MLRGSFILYTWATFYTFAHYVMNMVVRAVKIKLQNLHIRCRQSQES